MENSIRPKISSLTEKELALLLISCFRLIGREVRFAGQDLKEFLDEIFKYQGWMYADSFKEAFSRYAADQLDGSESLKREVSAYFVSRLMKLTVKGAKAYKAKINPKPTDSKPTPEWHYASFCKFVSSWKILPANPDWVSVFEYLVEIGKASSVEGWSSMGYHLKLRHSMEIVTEWAYGKFTIIK